MSQSARPRMARFSHVSSHRKIIAARIWDGPQSEIGKTVHVQIESKDLPTLRMLLEQLEAEDDDLCLRDAFSGRTSTPLPSR
jgi:hypothetical protein